MKILLEVLMMIDSTRQIHTRITKIIAMLRVIAIVIVIVVNIFVVVVQISIEERPFRLTISQSYLGQCVSRKVFEFTPTGVADVTFRTGLSGNELFADASTFVL
jgi:hypothetical protein